MRGSDDFQRFARAGLELLGVEVDETELAVMAAADSIYRAHTEALLEADLDQVAPESRLDPAAAPPDAE